MRINYNKLRLGETLNSMGPGGAIITDKCHNYGSVDGCDGECPALWLGECKIADEIFDNVDLDDEEINKLKKIYEAE